MQSNQTIGIPTSPDTSLVIAEIILASIDASLKLSNPKLKGFRHIDDYEFAFKSRSEAEDGLASLSSALKEFELELNAQKTQIVELPVLIEYPWVNALQKFDFDVPSKREPFNIVKFFDLAFSYHQEYKTDHVLKYAIALLRDVTIKQKTTWGLLQDFIYQSMIIEPTVIRSSLSVIQLFSTINFEINRDKLSDVLNSILVSRASMRHHSELAWSIWAMINWDIEIQAESAERISKVEDSCIALLALDARHRGLIKTGLDTSIWESYMNPESLYGNQWLLAYEANIKNWLPSDSDYVLSDKNFKKLKSKNVSFYNTDYVKSTLKNMPSDAIPSLLSSITDSRNDLKLSEESDF